MGANATAAATALVPPGERREVRGNAKQAALKDQEFRGGVNLYGAHFPRAREAGADTPSSLS